MPNLTERAIQELVPLEPVSPTPPVSLAEFWPFDALTLLDELRRHRRGKTRATFQHSPFFGSVLRSSLRRPRAMTRRWRNAQPASRIKRR